MLNSRRILAVVPARGGSKGVRLKNIHPLAGIPLIAHVGRLLKQMPVVDRSVVSTDDDAIVREAERSGLQAPFRRPASLSGDLISDHQVLQHALTTMESMDSTHYDVVLMLQPTSPLRRLPKEGSSAWTATPTP